MGERVLLTVRALSDAAKPKRQKGREQSQTTPRNEDARAQGHDEGSKVGGGGCRSRRVRMQLTESAGWVVTMNSHGVEISIAGCVEEMVRS